MNVFIIYLIIYSTLALMSAIGYLYFLKKAKVLVGFKKDFAKVTLYICFVSMVVLLTYLSDKKFPNDGLKTLRVLEVFPFVFGYGYLFLNLKKLKNLSK